MKKIDIQDFIKILKIYATKDAKKVKRDFPSSPVVKTPPFNAGGSGSNLGWETKIPHATQCGQKVKKKKKGKKIKG